MTWIKLDDGFVDHPKIVGLTNPAFRGYIAGLCYAARQLTDGDLPNALIRTLVSRKTRDELIANQLWIRTPTGVTIRDYLDYNPPGSEVKERRAKAAKRMADYRKRNAVSNAVTDPVTKEDVTLLVTPTPSRPHNASSTKKRADILWDALAKAMGRQPVTGSERGEWNRAVKQLREIEATPEDVTTRAALYRREWPEMEFTPSSLVKHWGRFDAASVVVLRPHECPQCGIGFPTEAKRADHLVNVHDWSASERAV